MKRDIKFRLFCEEIGEMVEVKTLCGRYAWGTEIDPVNATRSEMMDGAYDVEDGSHLMQFTGLRDKSGNEIYEGDILEHRGIGIWSVVWVKACLCLSCIKGKNISYPDRQRLFRDYEEGSFTIIGNIYENPELLEAA